MALLLLLFITRLQFICRPHRTNVQGIVRLLRSLERPSCVFAPCHCKLVYIGLIAPVSRSRLAIHASIRSFSAATIPGSFLAKFFNSSGSATKL